MSTQINNALVNDSKPSIFTQMNYVYKSAKSNTGFVVTTKQLKGVEPSWCSDSLLSCHAWIAKHSVNPTKGVDKQEEVRYDASEQEKDTNMNIESMNLQQLVALQLQVAQRIAQLVAIPSDNEVTIQNDAQSAEQASDVGASSEETAPQSKVDEVASADAADNVEETEPETRKKIRIGKTKKDSNIEAVAAKIEEDVCTYTLTTARAYIKESKAPIRMNMKVASMCDAINAYKQGGLEAVPSQYLTKEGVKMLEKATTSKEKSPAKKSSSRKSKLNAAR